MPRYTDRRTVLQTTGGLLAGTTLVTGTVAADEIEPLEMDVRQEALNPAENGEIPVEVTVPTDRRGDGGGWPFSPSDALFGVGQAFEPLEEGALVTITDEFEDGVASPTRFYPTPDDWILFFTAQDLRYPGPDDWDGTLGLGMFPDGVDDVVSANHWDTDTVRVMDWIDLL